jgi:hypothetical protein
MLKNQMIIREETNMRNFWIDSNIDGRNTRLAGGPRAHSGEMTTDLCVRSDGRSIKAITIDCVPDENNNLTVTAKFFNDERVTVKVDYENKGEITVRSSTENKISDIIENVNLTPAKKLKAIKELLG